MESAGRAVDNDDCSLGGGTGMEIEENNETPGAIIVDIAAAATADNDDNDQQTAVVSLGISDPCQEQPTVKNADAAAAAKNDQRQEPSGPSAARMRLVSFTLASLVKSRRSSLDPASILAAFNKSKEKAVWRSLSDYLALLASEPGLFSLSGGRVDLALSARDNKAAASATFYESLCSWHQVPHFIVVDHEPVSEAHPFAALLNSQMLPPPPSHGHCVDNDGPGCRLLVANLKVLVHAEAADGAHQAFFTFPQQQEEKAAGGGQQQVFFLEVNAADWAAGQETAAAASAAEGLRTGFLYLTTNKLMVLPFRYIKMEAIWKERSARLREEQYEKFLANLEEKVAGDDKQEIPSDVIGLDCEMVGVGPGQIRENIGRVSLVDGAGAVVYDTFVAPLESVTDYRTRVSGIRQEDLIGAPTFETVKAKVVELLEGKLLVGYALHHDLQLLNLTTHPKERIRDIARLLSLNGHIKSLKYLSERLLKENIQTGRHSSVEDAQAPVSLYRKFRSIWEAEPKSWGLDKPLKSPKQQQPKAAAKEEALHAHLSQLEKEADRLRLEARWRGQSLAVVGLACDTVATGTGWNERIVGRVSVVSGEGRLLLERFVAPSRPVTDYMTDVTGIRPEDLASALSLRDVQVELANLLAGQVLVGHSLHRLIKLLQLHKGVNGYFHPNKQLRDLEVLFSAGGITPELSWLCERYITTSSEESDWSSSAQAARAAVSIYQRFRLVWENNPSLWGRRLYKFDNRGQPAGSSQPDGRGGGARGGARGGFDEEGGAQWGWRGGRGGRGRGIGPGGYEQAVRFPGGHGGEQWWSYAGGYGGEGGGHGWGGGGNGWGGQRTRGRRIFRGGGGRSGRYFGGYFY